MRDSACLALTLAEVFIYSVCDNRVSFFMLPGALQDPAGLRHQRGTAEAPGLVG